MRSSTFVPDCIYKMLFYLYNILVKLCIGKERIGWASPNQAPACKL